MKYLVIFLVMLVLAYVLSRPGIVGPGAGQETDRDRAIAAHQVVLGMSAGDVLKSIGESAAQTSTPDGRIVWGYQSGQYIVFTATSGVVAIGTLGKDGEPYFTGKDAERLRH